MQRSYTLNRWQEPTRWVDTHEVAVQLVQKWVDETDGSPDSLVMAIEKTLEGVLKALCDG